MMDLQIDYRANEPLYQQLQEQILERIRSGALPPDHKLPPSRKLAHSLGVHRNTIVRVYEELESSGLTYSVVGRGTFVARASEKKSVPSSKAKSVELPWESLLSGRNLRRGALYSDTARTVVPLELINLGRFQPSQDLLPVQEFQRCLNAVLRQVGAKALAYSPPEGVERLLIEVSRDLLRRGIAVSPEDIVITTGSQQGVDLAARVLIRPDEPFLVESTSYTGALSLFQGAGARLLGVPPDENGPDPAVLEKYSRIGARGFYLMPNGQNPSGRWFSRKRRSELLEWSERNSVPLIEDDYNADLDLEENEHFPPALRSLSGQVLHLGTFSKKLIPALRIGYMVSPPPVKDAVLALKRHMDLGNSALMQYALAEFLRRGYLEVHLARIRKEYRRRRDALLDALQEFLPQDFQWVRPRRTLLLWLELPRPLKTQQVYQECLQEGVLISPGSLFGVGEQERHGIRLSFSFEPPERIREGVRKLGRILGTRRRLGERHARLRPELL